MDLSLREALMARVRVGDLELKAVEEFQYFQPTLVVDPICFRNGRRICDESI